MPLPGTMTEGEADELAHVMTELEQKYGYARVLHLAVVILCAHMEVTDSFSSGQAIGPYVVTVRMTG